MSIKQDIGYSVCRPHARESLMESLYAEIFSFKREIHMHRDLFRKLGRERIIDLTEEMIMPFEDGSEVSEEYFEKLRREYQGIFNGIHMGTINHLGSTEKDRDYDKMFDELRLGRLRNIDLFLDSAILLVDRTRKWEEQYAAASN